MINRIFLFLMLGTFFLTVVFPNSFNAAAAAFMALSFVVACSLIQWSRALARLMIMYFAGVAITLIYLGIGMMNGAPAVAVIQILLTYVCSPLIWIVTLGALLQKMSAEKLKKWMIVLSFMGIASVAIFFYLFLNFGVDSVSFFIDDPNINLKDGYSAATMHIYGSFIFLTGAFFAAPAMVSGVAKRYLLLSSFVLVAITSGRSALIISIFIGSTIGMLFLPAAKASGVVLAKNVHGSIHSLFKKILILAFIFFALVLATDIDVNVIVGDFLEKLLSGGGAERTMQANALLASVRENLGSGAGHGIGVPYIRNEDYPWRYELVWVATLHRVGLVGSLVYALPFVVATMAFLNLWQSRLLSEMDVFMFAGFAAALVASNTNPYIEAFSFQWMYVLPVVYFLIAVKSRVKVENPLSEANIA